MFSANSVFIPIKNQACPLTLLFFTVEISMTTVQSVLSVVCQVLSVVCQVLSVLVFYVECSILFV